MDIFDLLTMVGGLCLFLFGMNVMGQALERSAGSKLESMLGKLTSNKFAGLLTGLGVTAIIQSSSATTVMVVGFVNSGLMNLSQAINVIMGANIGTTVTAWILSLTEIEGGGILQFFKPMSFTPILALIGIGLYMFAKSSKKRDIGTVLLGFAVLMFGMDIMTGAVEGLADVPAFQELFLLFKNPILGVLAGAILTAIIQSSSASVGILQALAATGQVTMGAAIPIIMGQNIGTCVTALLSSFGTNKNAKRAALVHLSFNVIGTIVWLTAFSIFNLFPISDALVNAGATQASIAVAHSVFNILCVLLLLPMSKLLAKLAYKLVPDANIPEKDAELDERLLATPAVALERAHVLTEEMAKAAKESLSDSIYNLFHYSTESAGKIRELENVTDHYEDIIGTYLVKLSSHNLGEKESAESTMLLKVIGDFERIGDHAVNLIESAEELREKSIVFSEGATAELSNLCDAVSEILSLSLLAFTKHDLDAAFAVEPLEEVIDILRERLRTGHIQRLKRGECSIEAGFVLSDLLTNLERVSDHCSNVAGYVIDMDESSLSLHESLARTRAENPRYKELYERYEQAYINNAVADN